MRVLLRPLACTGLSGENEGMGLFEAFLARRGVIEATAMLEVLEAVVRQRTPIGQIALREQLLNVSEVCEVLDHQLRSRLPFGAIAVDLGYLTEAELHGILAVQHKSGPLGVELLRRKGLVDERRLSALLEAYGRELACEFSRGPEHAGETELLATRALPEALAKAQSLRPFSPPVLAALHLLGEPGVDGSRIAREVEQQPGLPLRVRQLLKMPGWRRRAPVKRLSGLVDSLGVQETRSLLLSASYLTLLDGLGSGVARLREHSVGVAAIAAALGRLVSAPSVGDLIAASFWHDVGHALMQSSTPAPEFDLSAEERQFPRTVHLVERMRFGYDHAVLGDLALRLWGAPERLADVVGRHHYHRPPDGLPPSERTTLGLLVVADAIEHSLASGQHLESGELGSLVERFGLASALGPNRLRAGWRSLREQRDAALELLVPPIPGPTS